MSKFSTIYRPLLALALPLIFIQICQASLGLIDTMVAGQYHYQDLAAVGLGSAMWTPVFILITGIMFVLVPKISELAATGNRDEMLTLFLRGKKMAQWLAIGGFLLVQTMAFLTPWLITDSAVATITSQYLHFVAFAFPAMVYVLLYRFISEGNSKLNPVMTVFVILLVSNTLLNLILVFGVGPFGELGGAGCGLATAISAYISLFAMQRLVKKAVPEIACKSLAKTSTLSARQLLSEGLPIGLAFVVEVLALTTLAFFASSLGVKEVAAHQIAINIAMVVFMIPLALSSATTIRIANFLQKEQATQKKQTAKAAMLMAVIYGLIASLIILVWGQTALLAFSEDKSIRLLATSLLVYVALFQMFDAIQIVAAGILRGLQQFVSPMLVILITYWLGVVPISYVIIGQEWWGISAGVNAIWLLLSVGIAIAALVLCLVSLQHIRKTSEFRHSS